jgi:hypothetical protein
MTSRLTLKQKDVGPRFGVYLLLDISQVRGPERYFIALTKDRIVEMNMGPTHWADALELFEAFALAPRPRRSWLHQLARGARWDGSPAEYAARYYPIGSWGWIESLRKIREEGASAPPK